VVKLLLDKGAELETKDTSYGQTPLSYAAKRGHEGVVALLLATEKVDADSKDNYCQMPLSWAELEKLFPWSSL
jgi:ankyrin repeat protein